MPVNRVKVTHGVRPVAYPAGATPWRDAIPAPVEIPEVLRNMEVDALAALAESLGGGGLVEEQRAVMQSASCSPCAARTVAARLRHWIATTEQAR